MMAESDIPTRDEMNARLEAVEARIETRFVRIDDKLDRMADQLGTFQSLVIDRAKQLEGAIEAVKRENVSTRITIIVTVVGAVIAGLAALWATQSNLLQAFQTGLTVRLQPITTSIATPGPAAGRDGGEMRPDASSDGGRRTDQVPTPSGESLPR
jgi:hypothetical protein